jgi:molecular chaperone DnaK (HSP70)
LTDAEIERMTKDAEAAKQQDMARNKVIELKNEAD